MSHADSLVKQASANEVHPGEERKRQRSLDVHATQTRIAQATVCGWPAVSFQPNRQSEWHSSSKTMFHARALTVNERRMRDSRHALITAVRNEGRGLGPPCNGRVRVREFGAAQGPATDAGCQAADVRGAERNQKLQKLDMCPDERHGAAARPSRASSSAGIGSVSQTCPGSSPPAPAQCRIVRR